MPRILIVAGDPSGDLYGSLLIGALRKIQKDTDIDAVGGPLMRNTLGSKDVFHQDLASLGVTGFFEPLKRIPTFIRLLKKIKTLFMAGRYDAVVCLDFYGFNRQILSAAKNAGVPAFYFISPQVWASRAGRIKHIKKTVSRMIVIFPFEEELYKKAGVPVSWVGHPLLDILPEPRPHKASSTLRLGLLPGSRRTEIRKHLPPFLEAARRILKDYPRAEVSVFGAPQIPKAFYNQWTKNWKNASGSRLSMIWGIDYTERSKQDFIITSSGTATLENALLGIPMVVVYKVAWATYCIAKPFIRVPHIAMANILAKEELVPELIQHKATPENIARASLDMLDNPQRLNSLRNKLSSLRKILGGSGATERAAQILIDSLQKTEASA